jgi:hypothetical protein
MWNGFAQQPFGNPFEHITGEGNSGMRPFADTNASAKLAHPYELNRASSSVPMIEEFQTHSA